MNAKIVEIIEKSAGTGRRQRLPFPGIDAGVCVHEE